MLPESGSIYAAAYGGAPAYAMATMANEIAIFLHLILVISLRFHHLFIHVSRAHLGQSFLHQQFVEPGGQVLDVAAVGTKALGLAIHR